MVLYDTKIVTLIIKSDTKIVTLWKDLNSIIYLISEWREKN